VRVVVRRVPPRPDMTRPQMRDRVDSGHATLALKLDHAFPKQPLSATRGDQRLFLRRPDISPREDLSIQNAFRTLIHIVVVADITELLGRCLASVSSTCPDNSRRSSAAIAGGTVAKYAT